MLLKANKIVMKGISRYFAFNPAFSRAYFSLFPYECRIENSKSNRTKTRNMTE
jgi:hypothetical protein